MTQTLEPPADNDAVTISADEVSDDAAASGPRRLPWADDIPSVTAEDMRPIKWQLTLSLVGLALGALMGIMQAMERLNINLYDSTPLSTYYQGLTIHGVALALVFTFCFANAFLSLTVMKGFQRPLANRGISDLSAMLAWAGVVFAAYAMLTNQASVLFTFYAPLKAVPSFYFGAALLLISTWLVLLNMFLTYFGWRRDNPGQHVPLLAFISIISYVMWFISSLGIAVEVLGFLLPWSMGLIDKVDPQFTRTLFWFTGHPIVYFWLMPIYVSWYMMLPKMVGGRVLSDGITRMVFIAFLLLIPVGVHHQFTDPGIPFSSKTIQWLLTFCIFYPSIITLFSVVSGLEEGARSRGGKGKLAWMLKLPWGDPAIAGQLLAGLGFMLGGMSGLINASFTINLVVHNTAFIPGHFHLTVGTAVALSIMAISYWLVPYLTGKELWSRRLGVVQVFMWFGGVLIFSRGQMHGGLHGMPRRTMINDATYLDQFGSWDLANIMTGIGGTIMFLSAVLFFVNVIVTLTKDPDRVQRFVPIAEVRSKLENGSWMWLDDIVRWTAVAFVFSAIIYGEVFFHLLPLNAVSRGLRLW